MAKILVVEDEPDLRELIVEQLDDEGHQTFEAGNGLEGLDRLTEITPDLVLSDITMPVMNGYKFFHRLKENHPEHLYMPFVFLTALSDREDELKGLRMGVDAYITKPIDFDIMMAKIEGLLRICRLQNGLEPPKSAPRSDVLIDREALAEPADRIQADRESIDKISSIAERDNGKIVAGKFQTVSLEKIRHRVGDQWQEVSGKILRNAELVLRQHLGAKDVFQITPAKDFTVCFEDLTAEQAVLRVDEICQKIWERLFGETEDDHLSSVKGSAHELALSPNVLDRKEDIFSEVEIQISQEKRKLTTAYQKRIEQIYTYEDVKFIKLLCNNGLPSKIDKLTFSKGLSDEIRNAFSSKEFDSQSLMNFQKLFFTNLKQKSAHSGLFSKPAAIISTDFSMVAESNVRNHYASLCKTLEKSMRGVLLIEVTGTPGHLLSHIDFLQPLPVGRRHQVLELQTPKQTSGLDWKQLHCSIVSMTYEHAKQHDGDGLDDVRNELKRHRIKFYLKEIPDGALNQAQAMKADLYSMMH